MLFVADLHFNQAQKLGPFLTQSRAAVEVALLGSPSLISLMVSVDVKQH